MLSFDRLPTNVPNKYFASTSRSAPLGFRSRTDLRYTRWHIEKDAPINRALCGFEKSRGKKVQKGTQSLR